MTNRPLPSPDHRPLDPARRRLLRGAAAALVAPLGACGGGGGGDGGPDDPADPAGRPAGWLVYRNSSRAAALDLSTGRALPFDPGDKPPVDPGLTAAPGRIAIAAIDDDNTGVSFDGVDPATGTRTRYRLRREFSFLVSAVMFSGDGRRIALALDEPRSSTDDERIARTLVAAWPAGTLLATLDGWEEPVFDRSSGDLLLRDAATMRLHRFSPDLVYRGPVGGFEVAPSIGAYDLSPDGRHLVYDTMTELRCFDVATGVDRTLVDRISSVRCPTFSPDGRHLAVHAVDLRSATLDFHVTLPHLLPFTPDRAIEVDSARHAIDTPIVETGGRMGWLA